MNEPTELKAEIKKLMVEHCMLKVSAEQIGDDQLLFGPGSLGLDSIDALQLAVALEVKYQYKFADPEAARKIMENVNTMAAAIQEHQVLPQIISEAKEAQKHVSHFASRAALPKRNPIMQESK